MDKIKFFLKKGTYTKAKIVVAIILSIVVASIYTYTRTKFVVDRLFIVGIVSMFISLHFILRLETIYNFIYKYRYYIAAVTLVVATLCEYSGSSIGTYNEILQGESTDTYFTPVLGKYRSIRSDEWVVNTPIFVSQATDKDNPYGYYNDNLRGTMTDMFSIVSPGVNDILTIAKPFNIGYLLFGAAKGLSITWVGKWLAFSLISFEFFMMITDKKKIVSLLGAMLVIFSAATQWWNITDVIMWGMLALILADKYLKTDKLKTKILCAAGIFLSAVSFIFVMYPAWQIPFIYIDIAIFISLCIKNKKVYKLKKSDFIIILIVILAISGIGLRYLNMSADALQATMSTDYPGERFEIGGGGIKVLFSYVYSFLFPYTDIDNPCEFAGMTSFYPIPMVLALIYIIRNKDRKEHMGFIVPLLILSLAYSAFSIFKTNAFFAKITFLYMSTGARIAIPLGFIQIILLVYLIGIVSKDSRIMSDKISKIVAILSSIVIFSLATRTAPSGLLGSLKSYVCGLILVIFIYLILTLYNEKNRKVLIIGLMGMALVTGLTVNPLQRGISVLTDKPLAKEIQKIVQEDSENNLWITNDTFFYMPNYLLASGARVINSTNIYPNMDLFKTILSEEDFNNSEIRKIYNRYAHITMKINDSQNKVELVYEDSIKVYLTPEKVKELGIKYIVATEDIEQFDTQNVDFEQIYSEQGVTIFKVNY